jgi:hypothetical protein
MGMLSCSRSQALPGNADGDALRRVMLRCVRALAPQSVATVRSQAEPGNEWVRYPTAAFVLPLEV